MQGRKHWYIEEISPKGVPHSKWNADDLGQLGEPNITKPV